MKKLVKFVCIFSLCMVLMAISVYAHSGGTDGSGGHYDHSTGDYHYHHGYSAHEHYDIDGDGKKDCPYTFDYDSINNGEGDADEEVENTKKKNKTFWSVCGDILICFIFAVIAFPFIAILLGFTALLPKKISNFLNEHAGLVYIISFVLTWLTFTIGYFMFNYQ